MRVCLVGEGMIELSRSGDGWRLGYGGDTLNTAIHLARAGLDVAYLTALGGDPFSDELRLGWAAEGLDLSLTLTDPDRASGLYAIRNDPSGERSFTYWRDNSAARHMFALAGIEAVLARMADVDVLAYSLITLAILPLAARERLFALCRQVRARGGRVAFDGNYRPRLWAGAQDARAARDAAIACADIGLPTLEDEMMLSASEDAAAVSAHWQRLGCGETIVKLGAEGCRLPDGSTLQPPRLLTPVDTSGAGDAFNGGYLAARISGASIPEAALAGHRLAGWVVMQPGAIPARTPEAPYP